MSLLCPYEDDGVSTDPQLQHNVAVGAEHGEDTAFISLRAPQLHQQTELICKPKRKHRHTPFSRIIATENISPLGLLKL